MCAQAFALNPDRRISQYSHHTWRIQDGYFKGAPTAVAQTVDGYLWVGTEAGLLRFDGVRFTPFRPPTDKPLRSPSIVSLLGASDGSLWIGTGSYLAHWKDGDLVSYLEKFGQINSISEDRDGTVWISRSRTPDETGALCHSEGTKLRCYGQAQGMPFNVAGPLLQDPAGGWWVGSASQLAHWRSGAGGIIYAPAGLKASAHLDGFAALAYGTDGALWAGVGHAGPGLGLQRLTKGEWRPFVAAGVDSSSLATTALLFDRDQALWIGTGTDGVYRITGQNIDHFRAADGLTGDTVNQIYEDHEGNIWITTTKGLDKFRDMRVVNFSKSEGLSADYVDTVMATKDGRMLIGNQEGFDVIQGRTISSIDRRNGLPGLKTTSMLEDSKGSIWIGVDDKLTVYSGGRFATVSRGGGKPIGVVECLTEDSDATIWLSPAAAPRMLLHVVGLKITEEIPVPSHRRIRALAKNPQGGIWIGFEDGDLGRYDKGEWTIIPLHRPKSAGIVLRLVTTPEGGVLGSTTAGLVGWRYGTSKSILTSNGLPCNRINSLIFDSQNTLWLYTVCGLVSIADSELQRWWRHSDTKIATRTFDILDGAQPAPTPFQPSATRSADGRLWFANGSVVQTIDPSRFPTNAVTPPVHIEQVIADGKEYPVGGELRLPALTRELEIDYTALSLVIPQRVRFRYKLDGWENDWRDAGTRRQAFYTNLRPGPYRFQVAACNDDGVWNNVGADLKFAIAPAYYQTAWFALLCGLALSGILWCLYQLRLKQVTEQIQQRLGARLEERERIARELHDTLLQGFQGLVLRFQGVMKSLPANEPVRKMMEEVLDRADGVLLEGRQSVRDLREEGVNCDELSQALMRCGEDLGQGRSSAFTLVVAGTIEPLDPIVFSEVYRIAREALANAFQHSGAAKIEAELTYSSHQVCIRIRDDGRGVDEQILKSGKAGHWGLSGMSERAEKIGAQLKLWSRPGAGTEVEVIIAAKLAYRRTHEPSLWLRARTAISRTVSG